MKAKKLKNSLCNPEPAARVIRFGFIAAAIAALASAFVCSPFIPGHGSAEIVASLTLIAPAALSVGITALKREIPWYTLRRFGRLSCRYLEDNGLLEQAAEEYFGEEGLECALLYKGDSRHRYRKRRNRFTRNFIFIMSDNVVLRYSELQRAVVTEATLKRKNGTRTVTYLILQMKDFSEIPAMSAVRNGDAAGNHWSYEHNMKIMETIMEHIAEVNPDCETSMEPVEYVKR